MAALNLFEQVCFADTRTSPAMKIQFQHIVYVFILGLAVSLLGAYLKISSWSGADLILNAGAVLQLSGGVLLAVWAWQRFRSK